MPLGVPQFFSDKIFISEIYMNNGYNNRPPYGGQNNAPRRDGQPYKQGGVPHQNGQPTRTQAPNGQMHRPGQMPRTAQQPYRTAQQPNGQHQYIAQQMHQTGTQYPPVRHKSRKQTQRAAGFVVLVAAILVMLLVSVIIFAARCASGSIGFGTGTTADTLDTTPIVEAGDSVGVSDTTEPVVTTPPEPVLDPKYEYSIKTEADMHRGYLLLINGDNEYNFDGGFTIQPFLGNKTSSYNLGGNYSLDATAMDFCNQMLDALALHMGVSEVLINSAYRTLEDQQNILDYYMSTKGAEYVEMYVGTPGFSEHHTGLAIDFAIYNTATGESYTFDQKTEYPEWLRANSYKYGYVQRYPEDKVDVTGIAYESWHYRYVGKPHAFYMVRENLCYEEYMELIRTFEFGEKHLALTDDEGNSWEIYYVPADESGTTKVPVPKYVEYEVSGNNVDGFIVTCHM